MKFSATGGTDIELLEEGTYTGLCTVIADLGVQPGSQQFPTPKRKVWFQWEVAGETINIGGEDKPRVVSQEYTASMSPKSNLRPMVEAWRGKAFATDGDAEEYDIVALLGKPCLLTVKHSKNGKYANVGTVMGLPKGTKAPKGEIEPFLYDTENDGTYEKLPKFIRDKIDGQLDPAVAKPPPPVNQKAPPKTTQSGRTAAYATMTSSEIEEQEASLAQARADAKGDVPEFDDEIPF